MKALMGTERTRTSSKKDNVDKLSVPPGFVSLTSIILRRVENGDGTCSSMAFGTELEPASAQIDTASNVIDIAKLKRSLKRRPWILHNQLDYNPEESGSEEIDMVFYLLCYCFI
ncbi:unnamed protein product [Ilex paraguariensis]|uniref:Uncharacterized protein n=1 Tax=Ilex paraguariensis TaxID=185542 RepID=A0ABC8U8E2_9AQUA